MIETAIKEDLILDKKLIIPKNKLDAIRIMNELHPVVGGQPTHEKDQPNDNNPILDLACTLANIHASGVGEHADLRPIQNEPPSFFYGEGFISGISSLKGNGILAIFGHWRDGSGNYAIKQFYYTEKEISYRNAISEDKWSAWIDVLTSNSQLDYNKLLNVPITSTLSDDKNKIASIFSVNEINRKANTAQTTANNADAKAVAAQKTADTGVANAKIADDKAVKAQARADAAFTRVKPIAEGGTGATTVANARLNLGLKGAALADLTSTLSDAKDIAASIYSVNEVNRKANTAQVTANNADTKAVAAQTKANQVPNPIKDQFLVGNTATGYKLITKNQLRTLLAIPSATNVVNEIGNSTTSAISQKAFTDLSFGIGQKWTNVISKRLNKATYKNETGKPIQLSIFYWGSGDEGDNVYFKIDGETIFSKSNIVGHGSVEVTNVIPPNSTYEFGFDRGYLDYWWEFI